MRTSKPKASSDAWVDQEFPSKNHGGGSRLRLCGDAAGNKQRFGLMFFARPFPLGVSVISAKLHVFLKEDAWSGQHIQVQRNIDGWRERKVTWNNKPAVAGGTIVSGAINGNDGDEKVIDVTPIYEDVTVGADYHGVRLSLQEAVKRAIYSSEHPNHRRRPYLEIEWAKAPEPPDRGNPSGGNAISKAQGIFDYSFGVRGRKAGQRQSAHQIQFSASADFSGALLFDSGKVADERALFDLSTTAFNVPADADYFYRVKAWDENDLESDWSDKWEFVRKTKGNLVLDSPGVGGVVHDLTFPVSWTFTLRTQEQASIHLYVQRPNGTWREVWHYARRKTADTSINVPKGIVKSGRTYKVRLRVWDDIDRVSVSGDPAYVEVEREFTYERDGTPDPVTNLAVTQFGESPALAITWDDAVEPDYYCIKVDGEEVFDRVEPADIRTDVDSFAFLYWRGRHGETPEIEVERVVNSAGNLFHSGGNPIEVAPAINVKGKWLADEDPADPVGLQVVGAEQVDFEIGESGETFYPVGSQKPIRIIDAIRGYEGSVSGSLLTTVAADSFLDLKGRNKKLRYVAQHMNIPIRLGESSLSPKADAHNTDAWVVGFDIFQVGEFIDVPGLDQDQDDD